MDYVEAPTEYDGDRAAVFLAGGITGCPDWQSEACAMLADVDAILTCAAVSDS